MEANGERSTLPPIGTNPDQQHPPRDQTPAGTGDLSGLDCPDYHTGQRNSFRITEFLDQRPQIITHIASGLPGNEALLRPPGAPVDKAR